MLHFHFDNKYSFSPRPRLKQLFQINSTSINLPIVIMQFVQVSIYIKKGQLWVPTIVNYRPHFVTVLHICLDSNGKYRYNLLQLCQEIDSLIQWLDNWTSNPMSQIQITQKALQTYKFVRHYSFCIQITATDNDKVDPGCLGDLYI